jgi:hypothetical protein
VTALLLPLAAVDTAARASAVADPLLRQVSYRGYSFEVPGSWPVIDLTRRPRDCVRFDRHAVYLGPPGSDESCPSRLVGTTEALVIHSAAAGTRQSSVENPVARRITVAAPRIRVTATFDTDPTQIYQILASAFLPAPIIQSPSPAAMSRSRREGSRSRAGNTASRRRAGNTAWHRAAIIPRALPARIANYHGLGFDTCTAPSTAQMQTWRRHSPYRAIGIYIGGSDEACAQPNLTARWLRREAAAGWHFLPMYVGPQADFRELSATPGHQGRAAANDAVAQAERLGLGPGTPSTTTWRPTCPARPERSSGLSPRGPRWSTGLAIPPGPTAARRPELPTLRGGTSAIGTRYPMSSSTRCGTADETQVTRYTSPVSGLIIGESISSPATSSRPLAVTR